LLAERRPVLVGQRHLGVQEGGAVLEHAHALRLQLRIERARRPGGHAVVELALQQQAHLHAAPRASKQRAHQAAARVEVGADEVEALARTAQRVQVLALDGVAVEQVVAPHIGQPHRAQRLGLGGQALAAALLHPAVGAAPAQPLARDEGRQRRC
jgi:hypothetical protein